MNTKLNLYHIVIFLSFFLQIQIIAQTPEVEPNGFANASGTITITADGSFTGHIDDDSGDTDFWLIGFGSSGDVTFTLDSFTGNTNGMNANIFSSTTIDGTPTLVGEFRPSPVTINLSAGLYYQIRIFTISNTSGNYQFTVSGAGLLPVELVSFNASVQENGNVKLNWETATEVNNYGFEIERKNELENWNKIGFVLGSGNSNSPKSYEFIDETAHFDVLNYRLKQIDYDGTYEYFEIELERNLLNSLSGESSMPNIFELSQNHPNPFNPSTNIHFTLSESKNVQLFVYDNLGRVISTLVDDFREAGNYEIEFDATDLSAGVYYYQINVGNFIETKKMVLLK